MINTQRYEIRLYLHDGSKYGTYTNVEDFQFDSSGRLSFKAEDGQRISTTLPSFITEWK